ncbi:MAG: hypothetical protein NTY38_04880 [Acidobacteria bacterium]|nr:hypothetical protein [Acidobacteriota bacterium]
MKPDPEYLRRYYAALSDEALLRLDGDELVDDARAIYADELARRKLMDSGREPEVGEDRDAGEEFYAGDEEQPEWLEEAGCACMFADAPGRPAASDAAGARQILLDAGIPCHLAAERLEAPDARTAPGHEHYEYQLMVPGKRVLEATSVLDKDFFNEEIEARWKAHFEELSDPDFRDLELRTLLAGYLDRVERLKRTYEDEVVRRKRGR